MNPLKWRRTNAQVWSLLLGKGGKITITENTLYQQHRWELRVFGNTTDYKTLEEAMNFVFDNFDRLLASAKEVAEKKAHDLGEAHRLFGLHGIDRSALIFMQAPKGGHHEP